ncbi:MAG: Rieske 2Fe-2S domain-containing protein [Usitatibacter sp.]
MTNRFVCRVADIPQNGLKEVEAEGGLKLLVASAGNEFFGYQAQCPHQDVALCEGLYDGSVLTCHMHLWQWDIRTGAPIGLAESPLQSYPLAVEGDSLVLGPEPSAIDVGELFRGLNPATLEKLATLASSESHPAGAVLYSPGDPAENIYVLDAGRVEFTIGRGEGAAPDGFMLKKGETFGWAALLEGYPQRIAGARCMEDSTLMRINGGAAIGVLEGDASAGFTVMRRLSGLIARYLALRGSG